MAVIIPIAITNITFREAEKNGAKWYRGWSKNKSHRMENE